MAKGFTLPTMTIAEAIRNEIDRRAISQVEAAALIGVRQQTISRWAIGELLPAPEYLPVLAKFLHVPVADVKQMRAGARRSRDIGARLDQIENRLSRIETALEARRR